MKKLILFFLVTLLSVGFSMGQAAPLPEQTVSFRALLAAAKDGSLRSYYGKDLTVTGWTVFTMMGPGKVVGGTLDGKNYGGRCIRQQTLCCLGLLRRVMVSFCCCPPMWLRLTIFRSIWGHPRNSIVLLLRTCVL